MNPVYQWETFGQDLPMNYFDAGDKWYFDYEGTDHQRSPCNISIDPPTLFGPPPLGNCDEYEVVVATRNRQTWMQYLQGEKDDPDRAELWRDLQRVE